MRLKGIVGAAALALAACHEPPAPRVQGSLLLPGNARELWLSPDGTQVATLLDASPSKTPGAPADIVFGTLVIRPVANGAVRTLGAKVANLPGSVVFSSDGRFVAYLAEHDLSSASGELKVAKREGGEPESLGKGTTSFTFSPSGDLLAWVANGVLSVRDPGGGEATVVAQGVSSAQFGARGTAAQNKLLVKRSVRTDGALLAWSSETRKLEAIARGVSAFVWAAGGDAVAFQADGLLAPGAIEPASKFEKVKGDDGGGLYFKADGAKAVKVSSEGAAEFKFAPKGRRLAFTTPSVGGTPGDLYVADGEATPVKVASRVAQFVFAPDGSLALLGAYDRSGSAGTLGVLPPEGKLFEVARSVRQFTLTPKGRQLVFVHGVVKNTTYTLGLSVRSMSAPADEKPRELDVGIGGYAVDEAEKKLAYKAHCIDEGRTCSLYVADLEAKTAPVLLAARVGAFEFVPGGAGLAVITSRPAQKLSGNLFLSLATVPLEVPAGARTAPVTVLDDRVAGDFQFAGTDRRSLVYVIDEPGRAGLGLVPIR